MSKYEKRTRENTNVPEICLRMLKSISAKMEIRNINLEKYDKTFCISLALDDTVPYCHEAIKAVQRTFTPFGWMCRMTQYKRGENAEKTKVMHGYIFTFSKNKNNFLDLPF